MERRKVIDSRKRKLREENDSKVATIPCQYKRFLSWWTESDIVIELIKENGEHYVQIRREKNE